MRIAYCIGVLAGIVLLACIGCDDSRTDRDAPEPAADTATGTPEYAETAAKPAAGTVTIELEMPEGYKINDAAPTKIVLKAGDAPVTFADGKNELVLEKPTFPAVTPVTFGSGAGTLEIEYVVHYCNTGVPQQCYTARGTLSAPVAAEEAATAMNVAAVITIEPPGETTEFPNLPMGN